MHIKGQKGFNRIFLVNWSNQFTKSHWIIWNGLRLQYALI